MALRKLTDHELQAAVDAVARAGGDKTKAHIALQIPRSTLQNLLGRAKERGVTPSAGLTDYDNTDDLARQVKLLTAELSAAKDKALTEDVIRRHIIKLTSSAERTATPSWAAEPHGKASAPGVPTLFCSDWHCGEVVVASQINGVNRYDIKIFRERVKALTHSAIHLLKIISPKLDYPGLVMPLGGDMVSGNIHDELTATNELNSMPTVLELFATLKWMISTMADTFGKVFLPCVTGNHGRDTVKIWNKDRHATSFDWLLYSLLAKHFEDDKRITFQIPDGPDAYYRIYGTRYLLTHGDQFRGGDGLIGCLGPIIRGDHKKRSRNAQIDMEYDVMLLGHWHQYIHHSRVIVNGSLKGYDEYAYNNNFGFEQPKQALWVTHPRYGITYASPVQVERKAPAPKSEWVSFKKE